MRSYDHVIMNPLFPGNGTLTRSATGCSGGARSPGPSRTPPAWSTRRASQSRSRSQSRCPNRRRTGSGRGPPTPSRPSKTHPSELAVQFYPFQQRTPRELRKVSLTVSGISSRCGLCLFGSARSEDLLRQEQTTRNHLHNGMKYRCVLP